jgi:hypothetical protein
LPPTMRGSVIVFALLTTALVGCGKMKKTQECNAFIDKVNTSLPEIQKAANTNSDDPKASAAAMRKVAELYDKLGTDISGQQIGTEEMKKYAGEYHQMCTKASGAAKKVAEAFETSDLAKAESAKKELDEVEKQEDTLVDNINKFCQTP